MRLRLHRGSDYRLRAGCGTNSCTEAVTRAKDGFCASPSPSPAPVATGNAVFPSAVNPKYSTMSAGKQRMDTCLDQYRANKATNGNGGLKWIQKGGGYYPECNKHLKGA